MSLFPVCLKNLQFTHISISRIIVNLWHWSFQFKPIISILIQTASKISRYVRKKIIPRDCIFFVRNLALKFDLDMHWLSFEPWSLLWRTTLNLQPLRYLTIEKYPFTPIPSPTPDKKDTNNYHTHNFDSKYFDTVPLLTNKARYYSYNIATTGL